MMAITSDRLLEKKLATCLGEAGVVLGKMCRDTQAVHTPTDILQYKVSSSPSSIGSIHDCDP